MNYFLQILFLLSAAVILYTYIGYGILIHLITKIKTPFQVPSIPADQKLPEVTMIIAAYNEARFIEQKIENSLSIDYPREKLKIWIVTDGSNDGTPDLVRSHPEVQLFHQSQRKGKIHAVNRVMKEVDSPIVVFTDANTLLNNEALKNMVRHYEDERVGGVAGEKRIFKKVQDNASGTGEGFYWRYESFLKKKDSELHSVMGAAGELFSVRTKLFEEPPQNMIIEDFYISLKIVTNGYRFIYEPEAFATETASASIGDEWKRKVRISAGAFQAMVKLLPLLNPFRFGMTSIQYISHRVLRWTLAPISLIICFITSLFLAIQQVPFFGLLLCVQVLFYVIAWFGYIYRDSQISVKGFFVPFYFAVMNLSVIVGFVRYLRGNQSVVWEKTERA